jgi:hypothetical protein
MAPMLPLRAVDGGVQIPVRAQPKASREGIVGLHGDSLKVAVTAPPAEGKANRAVAELLADAFGVRPSAVDIVAGQTSRQKLVRIRGLSIEEAQRRLAAILARREARKKRPQRQQE